MRYLNKMSWEGLYKMKVQSSEQLQTVLALCTTSELNGEKVTPSNQRLRTMARQHVDQMISPRGKSFWIGRRNFEARNGRIETGVCVKVHIRKKRQP